MVAAANRLIDCGQTERRAVLDKSTLRQEMIRKRQLLSTEDRLSLSRRIGDHLLAHPIVKNVSSLSVFVGMEDEIDSMPWLAQLAQRGMTIALPRVIRARTPLSMRLWQPGDAFEVSRFGVSEPSLDRPEVRPELVVAPLLAFDLHGWRLGYGGGFYDRTLEQFRADGQSVHVVGVAFGFQQVDAVPTGPHDQRLDGMIVETGNLALDQ